MIATNASIDIITITVGGTNCYLLKTGRGFFLIDTGIPRRRISVAKKMESSGCRPGDLKLIILTHADFDHSGNCAYFRDRYGSQIAMHRSESEAVEKGSLLLNRRDRQLFPGFISDLMFKIVLTFWNIGKFDRFRPDIYLEDGDDISKYGLDARVLHIPGHSKGSLGILTGDGQFFCGDLLVNKSQPRLNSVIDDRQTAVTSFEKLKSININTVYPGHGKPFRMEKFIKGDQYR